MAPTADIATLVIDCAEVAPMLRMYTALGGEPDPRYPGQGCLLLSGLTLSFRADDDYRPPTWPQPGVPTQLHLKFFVDSPDEMEEYLHGFGATTPDRQPHRQQGLVVMLDPAAHPFCIGTRLQVAIADR